MSIQIPNRLEMMVSFAAGNPPVILRGEGVQAVLRAAPGVFAVVPTQAIRPSLSSLFEVVPTVMPIACLTPGPAVSVVAFVDGNGNVSVYTRNAAGAGVDHINPVNLVVFRFPGEP